MTDALVVTDVRVLRGGTAVVDSVGFVARAGRVVAIVGPNGAGKSSLVKAIAGALPFEGTVRVAGESVTALSRAERARRVGYVPQNSELRSALAVEEVVRQGRYAHEIGRVRVPQGQRDAIAQALRAAGASGLAGRAFTTLSHGEKQRVLIARALATLAPVLLLDEPTAALDVTHALRLYRLLRRLAGDGQCVVVVLHALGDALEWTDEVLLLDRGKAIAFGPTREVFESGRIEEVYGVRLVPGAALGFRLASEADLGDGA